MKISVIVPYEGYYQYLKDCLESLSEQENVEIETLLVGSQDDQKFQQLVDTYKDKISLNVIPCSIEEGVAKKRNLGLENATGDYIYFIDSDDYIKEDMYEFYLNLIKKYDADVSICNLYDVIDGNECIRNKENGIREYSRLDILKEVLLDKNIQSYAWNKLYEKELFDEIKYPIGKKYEDIGTTF